MDQNFYIVCSSTIFAFFSVNMYLYLPLPPIEKTSPTTLQKIHSLLVIIVVFFFFIEGINYKRKFWRDLNLELKLLHNIDHVLIFFMEELIGGI